MVVNFMYQLGWTMGFSRSVVKLYSECHTLNSLIGAPGGGKAIRSMVSLIQRFGGEQEAHVRKQTNVFRQALLSYVVQNTDVSTSVGLVGRFVS